MAITERPPSPASFLPSLRSLGTYTFETAIADIIDNSITAGANKIRIYAQIDDSKKIQIAILDNGKGITKKELPQIMTLGSTSALDVRAEKDLGRFGLGMKTASFSLCRKLTVYSVQDRIPTCAACWDIDFMIKSNSWALKTIDKRSIIKLPFFENTSKYKNSTTILLENIDAYIAANPSPEELFAYLARLKEHLALIFHRYLEGEDGVKKITIFINDSLVEPNNPFDCVVETAQRVRNTKKLSSLQIPYKENTIDITPYRLPFQKAQLTDYESEAKLDIKQGFYIYRNKRLIMHSSWHGLKNLAPMITKRARVQVDISNVLDIDFGINVAKTELRIPSDVRTQLREIITQAYKEMPKQTKAKKNKAKQKNIDLWKQKQTEKTLWNFINTQHPLVQELTDHLKGKHKEKFMLLLDLLGITFPKGMYPTIPSSNDEENSNTENIAELDDIVKENVIQAALNLIDLWGKSKTSEQALDFFAMAQPFNTCLDEIRQAMGIEYGT